MGSLWDKIKEILGFGKPEDSMENKKRGFEDRILNADRHHFKVDEPEPQAAEK